MSLSVKSLSVNKQDHECLQRCLRPRMRLVRLLQTRMKSGQRTAIARRCLAAVAHACHAIGAGCGWLRRFANAPHHPEGRHKLLEDECPMLWQHGGAVDACLRPRYVQCWSNSYRGRLIMLDEYFASSSTLHRNERVKLAAMFWNIVGAGMFIGGVAGAFFYEGPLFWGKVGIAVLGIVLALIFQRVGDRMLGYLRAP